jgi:1-phosphatidylinositol-3-phosphate 5-kinase
LVVWQKYWATQFRALRQAYLGADEDEGFVRSLGVAKHWDAQGGKSGAVFLKSADGRFVVKQITRTELQMFLDYAPAYFEYLAKHFFHGMETVLCKVIGVYTIGYQNRVTGKRFMEQVTPLDLNPTKTASRESASWSR